MAVMLTSKDNPYNYFTQFDDWFGFDMQKGYNSCGLLARFVRTSNELDADIINQDIEDGIDRILGMGFDKYYKKIYDTDEKTIAS